MDHQLGSSALHYQSVTHRQLVFWNHLFSSQRVYEYLRFRWIGQQARKAHRRMSSTSGRAVAHSAAFGSRRGLPWRSVDDSDLPEWPVQTGRWNLLSRRLRYSRPEEPWVPALCEAFSTSSLEDVKVCGFSTHILLST